MAPLVFASYFPSLLPFGPKTLPSSPHPQPKVVEGVEGEDTEGNVIG